jgi:hypothetical protein
MHETTLQIQALAAVLLAALNVVGIIVSKRNGTRIKRVQNTLNNGAKGKSPTLRRPPFL